MAKEVGSHGCEQRAPDGRVQKEGAGGMGDNTEGDDERERERERDGEREMTAR